MNVTPDANTGINFFITDNATGVESQILPNKVTFYDAAYTSNPNLFIFGNSYSYSYTVVLENAVEKAATDGVLTVVTGTTATLSSNSVMFGQDDLGASRKVYIYDASNSINNGSFAIQSVTNGVVTIYSAGGFTTETGIRFQVTDSSLTSARILFTDDLALTAGFSLRATVVDTKDAAFFDAGWEGAYTSLTKIDCDIVVPLPSQTISSIFMMGKVHVTSQSNVKNRHERVLFIGGIQGLTPDNVIGNSPAAVEDIGILEGIQGDSVSEILAGSIEDLTNYKVQDAFGDSFRVEYFYPDQIVLQVGGDRLFADGFFMAAAAAGFFAGTPWIAIPLTNKTLAGFTILRNKLYAPAIVEQICSAGITLLQPVIGGGEVIWSKTTTESGAPEEEEISIVFIRDRIAKDMRNGLKGNIGKPESPTFASTLFSQADGLAKSFVSRQLITAYKDLTVKRNGTDPRQWDIGLMVQPVYPINWIYINIGIGVIA
jgi:hypothetical protein